MQIFALLTLAIVGPLTAVTIHHYPEIQQEGHHHKAPIPIVKQDFQQSKEGYQFRYICFLKSFIFPKLILF